MPSRKLMLGTGAALAGLAGLASAALMLGAPADDAAPASQPARTDTQVVTTVERRTRRVDPEPTGAPSVTPATLVSNGPATPPAPPPPAVATQSPADDHGRDGRGSDDGPDDDHGRDDDHSGPGGGDHDDDSGHGRGRGRGRGGDDDDSAFEDD